MLGFLQSYFTETSYDPTVKARKQNKPNYIYRDELDKKASSPIKLKKRAQGEAKPLLQRELEDGKKLERQSHGCVEEKGELRVKVLMTKEQAARLLSRCKDGGVLEFKDVARELVQIPTSRVCVVSSSTSSDCSLESIAEEL